MNQAPRMLIVEDDPAWQQILAEIAQDAGLEADLAGTLEEALPLIRKHPHRIAIVDLSLRQETPHNHDGLRVLDALRTFDPGCAAVLLTGYATVELAVSAITGHGAISCIRKEQFSRRELQALIDQALARPPRPLSPATAPSRPPRPRQTQKRPTRTALLVEDDAGWREILAEILSEAGYTVDQCSGFGEALGYLQRTHYALIVIDLALEGQTTSTRRFRPLEEREGYRLIERINNAGTPVIVVSGIVSTAEVESLYADLNPFAVVEKQAFDRQTFSTLIQEANAAYTPPLLTTLTQREREVLVLLTRGLTNKAIAETLYITPNTVKRHLKSIFAKLGVHTRAAAVAEALRLGLLAETDQ